MTITKGDFNDPRIIALLKTHFETAHAVTPPGSAHALDLSGLQSADIDFWALWDGDTLLAIGALKRLSPSHGEVKSMHVAKAQRRKGAGRRMLDHIVEAARSRGMTRLSLETGSFDYFAPARALYAQYGFVPCPPYGSYKADPNSAFMTLDLDAVRD